MLFFANIGFFNLPTRQYWWDFLFIGLIPRGPNFAEIYARGGGGLLPRVHRDRIAPWGPDFALAKRESRPFRPDFFTAKWQSRPFRPEFRAAKRQSRPFRPEFRAAKRQSRPFHPDFSTAKRQSRPFHPDFRAAKRESRPFHPALGGAAGVFGAKTARFLITREGSKFYETATKGDFFVATSSPLVNLLFCPRRAKLWLRRGKTPPPRKAPRPRDPLDRPRPRPSPPPPRAASKPTVTGPRLARNQRALRNPAPPPQPDRSRGLSGCPQRPTLSAGRPAESPKRENEKKEGTPDGTTAPDGKSAPALPTPGLSRPLRLTMAGRAPSRNAPSVAESPQNQRRRSLP